MKKSDWLKIINPILTVLVSTQILSGLLRGKIPYRAFEIFHKGSGKILIVIIALHVWLNWNWFKATYWPKHR
jgi:hypothetical protein